MACPRGILIAACLLCSCSFAGVAGQSEKVRIDIRLIDSETGYDLSAEKLEIARTNSGVVHSASPARLSCSLVFTNSTALRPAIDRLRSRDYR